MAFEQSSENYGQVVNGWTEMFHGEMSKQGLFKERIFLFFFLWLLPPKVRLMVKIDQMILNYGFSEIIIESIFSKLEPVRRH